MRKSSGTKGRKVTPPSPTFMSSDQFGKYLSDLRSNRTVRPGGARPLPSTEGRSTPVSRSSFGRSSLNGPPSPPSQQRVPSQVPSIGGASMSSRYSTSSARGRDYYPSTPSIPLKPSEVVPSATYIERGQRWMEKEEAFSLRDAMEEMEIRDGTKEPLDDESRVYNAALNEAAELVWQHQNNVKPLQPDGPYRYKPHLRRNSYAHARTASIGRYGDDIAPSGLRRDPASRSVSGSSTDSSGSHPGNRDSSESTGHRKLYMHSDKRTKPYGSVGNATSRRRSSFKRNISGEVQRPFSGDQIWEEPDSVASAVVISGGRASPAKLGSKVSNSRKMAASSQDDGKHSAIKPLNRIEIYRNPPSQSRNPLYTTNTHSSQSEPAHQHERTGDVERRSDDIRAATSRKLKDRSSKLPEPTAVSDSPGRPIVSFDTKWKAPEETTDSNPDRPTGTSPRSLQGQSQSLGIPSINIAELDSPRTQSTPREDLPSISIAECDMTPRSTMNIPVIAIDDQGTASQTPSITPGREPSNEWRPLPVPKPSDIRSGKLQLPTSHWSPAAGTIGRPTAVCHECGFPIEGRFVALAGTQERFHPQCFSCFSCGTSLEAMEISPEPDSVRKARLERIRRREAGQVLEDIPGMTMEEDGDSRLRFFCHLDWHELFAPKCKHCKTPIIGEHVVALGEHWHNGHFFCAECGDPFEHGMTHIEKDGYAWCVKCQTKRTERRAPRCKMCKTAVIGEYIQALGGEWHEHCFRCADCDGGFPDGQIFTKEVKGVMVVMCTGCRTRDLKT